MLLVLEKNKLKEFKKKDGIVRYRKDCPIDSNTGRVYGHNDHEGTGHGSLPHINIKRSDRITMRIDLYMVDLYIKKLITAIGNGKARGFDEIKNINGENYLFEYAIKKEDEQYNTYLFHIPENKMEMYEDYATEEFSEFSNIEDAFNYFKLQDVDIRKFAPIKRTLPF